MRQRLAVVREEHGVPVAGLWLQQADGEALFGDDIGVSFSFSAVERIDLTPQLRSFERAARLALLVEREPWRKARVVQQQAGGLRRVEARLPVILAVVRSTGATGEMIGDGRSLQVRAGVKPGAREDRRHV